MQDNPHFLQYLQNCENVQHNGNFTKKITQNNAKLQCKNSFKNNDELNLTNNDLSINSHNQNNRKNNSVSNATSKCAQKDTLKNIASENFTPFKNSYNNVSYKNNATQNASMSCKNSVSCKRDVSCQSKAGYKSTAYYENGINNKICTTKCSATTKICLWIFLFVACLAVTIGFGYFCGSNGSLKVAPEIETASAAGETWSGSGTQADPYQISNYTDLLALSTACNTPTSGTTYNHYQSVYFKLTADITIAAADLNNTTTSTTWTPIACDPTGVNYANCYFSGIFDGDGHTITYAGDVTVNVGVSTASSPNLYYGLLFGYVLGDASDTASATYGIVKNTNITFGAASSSATAFTLKLVAVSSNNCIGTSQVGGLVGRLSNGKVSQCKFNGKPFNFTVECDSISGWDRGFAGIVGYTSSSRVDNCEFNTDYSFSDLPTGILEGGAAVVGYAPNSTIIEKCKVNGNVTFLKEASGTNRAELGGILGSGSANVSNCGFYGNFVCKWRSGSGTKAGAIAGGATNIENCVIEGEVTLGEKGGAASCSGIIVGSATSVSNCYANVSNSSLCMTGTDGEFGIIAGSVTNMSNCAINVQLIDLIRATSLVSYASGTVNNCIAIVDVGSYSGTLYPFSNGFYNCVIIASGTNVTAAYPIKSNTTNTSDTTNGLYSLTSTDANLSELKSKTTYTSGSTHFTWNTDGDVAGSTTGGHAWDFANTWMINSTMNDGYPTLQMLITSYNITLNVTTNLSGSTLGTTTGSSGSSSATATANPADQFIIYRLDESGNLVNQFVVRNGSTVTFEVDKNKSFTIMINYKLYMVTTIGTESTNKKTYTPTADTTIDIDITAPSGVNNWIVI